MGRERAADVLQVRACAVLGNVLADSNIVGFLWTGLSRAFVIRDGRRVGKARRGGSSFQAALLGRLLSQASAASAGIKVMAPHLTARRRPAAISR